MSVLIRKRHYRKKNSFYLLTYYFSDFSNKEWHTRTCNLNHSSHLHEYLLWHCFWRINKNNNYGDSKLRLGNEQVACACVPPYLAVPSEERGTSHDALSMIQFWVAYTITQLSLEVIKKKYYAQNVKSSNCKPVFFATKLEPMLNFVFCMSSKIMLCVHLQKSIWEEEGTFCELLKKNASFFLQFEGVNKKRIGAGFFGLLFLSRIPSNTLFLRSQKGMMHTLVYLRHETCNYTCKQYRWITILLEIFCFSTRCSQVMNKDMAINYQHGTLPDEKLHCNKEYLFGRGENIFVNYVPSFQLSLSHWTVYNATKTFVSWPVIKSIAETWARGGILWWKRLCFGKAWKVLKKLEWIVMKP